MRSLSAAAAAHRPDRFCRHYRTRVGTVPALPAGLGRDQLISLIERVAHRLPVRVGAAALATFRRMAELTRPSDWTSSTAEPVCYMAQTELAALSDRDPSRIRRHEAALARAGLIERRTAANGARSGFLGCGIFFSIAIERLAEFQEIADRIEIERQEAADLRGRRSTHRKHLAAVLDELSSLGVSTGEVAEIRSAFEAWPDAGVLHRMDLGELAAHESDADALCRAGYDLLDNAVKTSGPPRVFARSYIQDTTQDPSVSCNASVDERRAADAAQDDSSAVPPDGGPERGAEQSVGAARAADKLDFITKLGPERLYHLASDEMRFYLDGRRGRDGSLRFHDFVIAARMRRPELGINASVWHQAEALGGEDMAMICLLITDARRSDPVTPVYNPGGYMRGMVRACEQGQLNLTQSLIGLSERRRAEDA